MPNYVQGQPGAWPPGLGRGERGFSFGALTAVAIAASPGGLVRAAGGTVTVTTTGNHNFQVGQSALIGGAVTSVGGTNFGGNYLIASTPSPTTATLIAQDGINAHQAPDTGGAGTITSIAFEQPTVPQAGKSFGFTAGPQLAGQGFGFIVDGQFSAAPGAFEVDIQVAPVDVDSAYQTVANGNITTADGTNFTFHSDNTFTNDTFVRLKLLSRANAVGLIASIRRP